MIHQARIPIWTVAPGVSPQWLDWLTKVLRGPMLMSDMSDYMENNVGNHILRNQAFTPPVTIYIALYTAATTDAAGGTEVPNTAAYARTAVTFDAWAGASGLQDNPAIVTFPTASGANWGTITHGAIVDSATWGAGNFLLHGALSSSVIINDGDTIEFPAGNVDVTFA